MSLSTNRLSQILEPTRQWGPHMKRATSTRSLLTIPFTIPAYCSPDQALAIVKLLEGLRQLILADCPIPLFDEPAKLHKTAVSNKSGSSSSKSRHSHEDEDEQLPF